jgi:hypothetical protein
MVGYRQHGVNTMLNNDTSRPDFNQAQYSAATLAPFALHDLSDEECLTRLAQAIEDQNSEKFEEIAMLIGRLAVTIE